MPLPLEDSQSSGWLCGLVDCFQTLPASDSQFHAFPFWEPHTPSGKDLGG